MKHPFLTGAIGYPLLELAWRGRTHPSMALAGGVGGLALQRVSRMEAPLMEKALLGGLSITGVEAACGLIFNRRHQVWDYRRMPLNLGGQVCLPFALLWSLLAAGILCIDNHHPNR